MQGAMSAATTGLGVASSVSGAKSQNSAISASLASQRQAGIAQQRQVAKQAAQSRQQEVDQAQAILGRIRVMGAEGGVGMAALERQAIFDSATNIDIIDQNEANNLAAIRSGYQASAAETASKAQNPIFDALIGGLQGLSSGLQISDGISRMAQAPAGGGGTLKGEVGQHSRTPFKPMT